MKTFGQFAQQINEGRGLFAGHHVGDDIVFLEGPYRNKGSWNIVSHDVVSDIHSAVEQLVSKGYEVASEWSGPGKAVTDSAKVEGAKKGRIIVLNGSPNLLVVIYSGNSFGGTSPKRFGFRYAASSESLDLKPQALGIQDREYTMDQLANTVIPAIYERDDLDGALKGYLELLLEYYWNNEMPKIKTEIKDEYSEMLSQFPMGQIKKNYGEIIGPFAILNSKSKLFKDMGLNSRTKILFPMRGNEPLVDFYLVKGGQKIPFSAKSGKSTTNTVKPGDISNLLAENPGASKKWGDSLELKVLMDLNENTGVNGPMVAAFNLKKSVKEFKKISKEMLDDWLANSANKGKTWKYKAALHEEYAKAIGLRPSARSKPSFGEILYYTEVAICNQTKGRGILEYAEFFNDVVGGAVNYINLLNIGKDGMPTWHTSEGGSPKVTMRTKNGTTRIAADKLGLQIIS